MRCSAGYRERSIRERTRSIVTDADHPLTVIALDNVSGDLGGDCGGCFGARIVSSAVSIDDLAIFSEVSIRCLGRTL